MESRMIFFGGSIWIIEVWFKIVTPKKFNMTPAKTQQPKRKGSYHVDLQNTVLFFFQVRVVKLEGYLNPPRVWNLGPEKLPKTDRLGAEIWHPNGGSGYIYIYMGVSKNMGKKTSQIIHLFIGFSIFYFHHPFWGGKKPPIFGNNFPTHESVLSFLLMPPTPCGNGKHQLLSCFFVQIWWLKTTIYLDVPGS